MILIGRLFSPLTRRVAVALEMLGLPYEVEQIPTAEQEAVRRYNPLGRVPSLVLDDGEILIDSHAIIDHLAEQAGDGQTILPPRGDARRRVLKANALIAGALEKIVAAHYERTMKPAEKVHEPFVARCHDQARSALDHLESWQPQRWLCGAGPSIADITVATTFDFLEATLPGFIQQERYPRLLATAAAVRETEAYVASGRDR